MTRRRPHCATDSASTSPAVRGSRPSSVPSRGRLFGDKDGLLDAVAEHVMATYVMAAAQAGKGVLASRVHRIARTGRLRVSERSAVDLLHAAGTGAVLTLLSTPAEQRDPELAGALLDAVLSRIVTDAHGPVEEGPWAPRSPCAR